MSDESGLKCPECKSFRLRVVDTRPRWDTMRRIRECHDCGSRFQTIEVVRARKESA